MVNVPLPVADILRVARSHGALTVRVFGSRARGDENPSSDLDLLVGLEPDRSLLDLIAIKQDLEDLMGCTVDVVTEGGLSPLPARSHPGRSAPVDGMNAPSQLAYLEHIRDALMAVKEFTASGREGFFASKMERDAVVRNLEVVGEAAKGLSDDTRGRAPGIPWRRIAGMRDVLIHHYFGVDFDVVWRVVEVEVPSLGLFERKAVTGVLDLFDSHA